MCECERLTQLLDDVIVALADVISDVTERCIFSVMSTVNTTSDDSGQQEDVVDEIVREVEDVSCPGEPIACSGHGTCSIRRCTCHLGSCALYLLPKLHNSRSTIFIGK